MFKILIISCVFLVSNILANTYTVSSLKELRNAIYKANANDSNATINISTGTYDLSSDGIGELFMTNSYKNTYKLVGQGNEESVILDGFGKSRVIKSEEVKLILKNLTVTNGYLVDGEGAGVKANNITIDNVVFDSNKAIGNDSRGGALFAKNVSIDNSTFINNSITNSGGTGGYGAGLYIEGKAIIKNSFFEKNFNTGYYAGTGKGGAIYQSHDTTLVLINNRFKNNKATCNFTNDSQYSNCGGGADIFVKGTGDLSAINNIFDGSTAKNKGTSIRNRYSSYGDNTTITLINNTFKNMIGTPVVFSKNSLFVNNLFETKNSFFSDKSFSVKLYNNILDITSIDVTKFDYKNIIKLGSKPNNLGMIVNDEITSGITGNYDWSEYLNSDINEKPRGKLDKAIDIGAIETSNESVYISDFLVQGTLKRFTPLNISFTANVSDNSTIKSYYIDFGESVEDNYINIDSTQVSHIYKNAGNYIIKIKLVDNKEEEIINSYAVEIFDLSVDEAIEYGKELALNGNTTENNKNITKTYIDTLNTGWQMLGTNSDIDLDSFNIFNNLEIVWYFNSETNSWEAHSSGLEDKILANPSIQILNKIPANKGFWIKK